MNNYPEVKVNFAPALEILALMASASSQSLGEPKYTAEQFHQRLC